MFQDRTTLRSPDWPTFEFDDRDGDTCCMQFYENADGDAGLFELSIYSASGCMVLTKEQAILFANKILEHIE
ncbi:hypothetical protein [Siccibacter colletis]|uniref:hypothetical protein n=1 Tax=Siccibacter colletis TaxID=1505757 RepID=UPI001267C8E9|nr:hypothetical protein [Siccibacter colletis]